MQCYSLRLHKPAIIYAVTKHSMLGFSPEILMVVTYSDSSMRQVPYILNWYENDRIDFPYHL